MPSAARARPDRQTDRQTDREINRAELGKLLNDGVSPIAQSTAYVWKDVHTFLTDTYTTWPIHPHI